MAVPNPTVTSQDVDTGHAGRLHERFAAFPQLPPQIAEHGAAWQVWLPVPPQDAPVALTQAPQLVQEPHVPFTGVQAPTFSKQSESAHELLFLVAFQTQKLNCNELVFAGTSTW